MRTIGKKWKNIVKKETLAAIRRREKEKAGEVMMFYGIDNEIVDNLPEEIWETWEGADGEIRRIIEEVLMETGREEEIV